MLRHCVIAPGLRLLQYAAMDEFTRLRVLSAYPEQSTFSSVNFLRRRFKQHAWRGIRVECVQTDSGFVCTGCFSNRRLDLPALFAGTAGEPEVRHKPIRLYPTLSQQQSRAQPPLFRETLSVHNRT